MASLDRCSAGASTSRLAHTHHSSPMRPTLAQSSRQPKRSCAVFVFPGARPWCARESRGRQTLQQRAAHSTLAPSNALNCPSYDEDYLPFYTTLDKNVLTIDNEMPHAEALRAGLKALKALGVDGVFVDVWWGIVEAQVPGEYNWAGYRRLFQMVKDTGLKIKVGLSFHSASLAIPLPAWVIEEGRSNPDIFYTDKAGGRCGECISLGIDDLPVLRGRTGVQIYEDFMTSFRAEFQPFFGTTIKECLIGLGPNGELKYPSHPTLDKRWTFPGVGEFQCYDRFMSATLKACAEQVLQPSWGLGGPHDAGSYCMWPHQTGFFHQSGNWSSPYGKFFLQWYSEMLNRHADSVLGAARNVFKGCPLQLSVRLPSAHWWFSTASHAPELTSGYYNTASREGYLPIFKVLARQGVTCYLGLADLRCYEQSSQAFCDPDKLLMQQRTVAAALGVPVAFENAVPMYGDGPLRRMETITFESASNQGIDLPMARAFSFHSMSEDMFEPANWRNLKAFVSRFQQRVDTSMERMSSSRMHSMSPMDVPIMPEGNSKQQQRDAMQANKGKPAFAK